MKFLFFSLSFLFVFATDCLADTVVLKNKESLSGIIVKEGESYIILDLGFGTIDLPRAEIESIEKSDETTNIQIKKKWQESYFESFPAPNEAEEKLLTSYKELVYRKKELKRSIFEKETIAEKISFYRKEIPKLQDDLSNIGEELEANKDRKNVKKYNSLVVEFNAASKQLREAIDELNELQGEYKHTNEEVIEYINQFQQFSGLFNKKYDSVVASDSLTSQQRSFYESLKQRMDELNEEVRQEEVNFVREENRVFIKAILNNKVTARMLVDTGATLTVISRDIGNKLGIDYESLEQEVELRGVSGQHLAAKFVLLDTVKVGEVEAENVVAAIVEEKTFKGIDGFLGMSFLNKFSFSVDAQGQKLVFSFLE